MAASEDRTDSPGKIAVLQSMLAAAERLVGQLATDPLVTRLLAVFTRMPAGDREPLLGVLEREVDARLLTAATEDGLSCIQMRPNPGARLYARVIEGDDELLSREETVMASLRAMRQLHRAVGPAVEVWADYVRGAFRLLDPDELATIERFLGLLQTQIVRCRDEGAVARPGVS
jgi:hypothetical protein